MKTQRRFATIVLRSALILATGSLQAGSGTHRYEGGNSLSAEERAEPRRNLFQSFQHMIGAGPYRRSGGSSGYSKDGPSSRPLLDFAKRLVKQDFDDGCNGKSSQSVKQSILSKKTGAEQTKMEGQWCARYVKYALAAAGCLKVCPFARNPIQLESVVKNAAGFSPVRINSNTTIASLPPGAVMFFEGCRMHTAIKGDKGQGDYSDFHRSENVDISTALKCPPGSVRLKSAYLPPANC